MEVVRRKAGGIERRRVEQDIHGHPDTANVTPKGTAKRPFYYGENDGKQQ